MKPPPDQSGADGPFRAGEAPGRALFGQSPAPLFYCTADGCILDCTDAFALMCGYPSREGLIHRAIGGLCPSPEHFERLVAQLQSNGRLLNHRVELRRTDGSPLRVLLSVALVLAPDGTECMHGAAVDIDEISRLTDSFDRSGAFMKGVLDAIAACTVIVDSAGRIVTLNRAWRQFAEENGGDGPAVKEGANYLHVCDKAADAYAEAALIAKRLRSVLAGGADPEPVEYECHCPSELRWFQAAIHGFDWNGERFAVVMHHNVNVVRASADREALLERREAVAMIGAGIAHEFNSMLLAISIQLHRQHGDSTGAHPAASAIRMVRQAQSLATALLDLYFGPDAAAAQLHSLHPWLPETVSRLTETLPPGTHVQTHVA